MSAAVAAFRALVAYFALIAVAHLVFLALRLPQPATVTQIVAMPVLAIALWRAGVRVRLTRWMLVGLGFSFLGDTVPRFLAGDGAFLAMLGAFLLAQVAYIVAFAPLWRRSVAGRDRLWLLPYAAVFAGLVVACLPQAGALAPAVVLYGLLLVTMAVLASGVSGPAWIGGALFFASDGMIALARFADWWPLSGAAQDIAVMTTYLVAQLLLVLGVLRHEGFLLRAASASSGQQVGQDGGVDIAAGEDGDMPAGGQPIRME